MKDHVNMYSVQKQLELQSHPFSWIFGTNHPSPDCNLLHLGDVDPNKHLWGSYHDGTWLNTFFAVLVRFTISVEEERTFHDFATITIEFWWNTGVEELIDQHSLNK